MVLKDWKKINDGWVLFRRSPLTGKITTGYITIIRPGGHLGRHITYLVDGKLQNQRFQRHFKTKNQAIKFTKTYMRKH